MYVGLATITWRICAILGGISVYQLLQHWQMLWSLADLTTVIPWCIMSQLITWKNYRLCKTLYVALLKGCLDLNTSLNIVKPYTGFLLNTESDSRSIFSHTKLLILDNLCISFINSAITHLHKKHDTWFLTLNCCSSHTCQAMVGLHSLKGVSEYRHLLYGMSYQGMWECHLLLKCSGEGLRHIYSLWLILLDLHPSQPVRLWLFFLVDDLAMV